MKKGLILCVLIGMISFQTKAQTAHFTSDSPRCMNDTVHFFPDPPGGTILQEVWDFGDGNTITYLPPALFPVFATHKYAFAGIFSVNRTVKFTTGILSYTKQVQTVPYPVSNFSSSTVACAGQPVNFYDLSYSNAGPIQSWNWNFGDPASGINNFSTQQNPSHIFSSGGTYLVTLTVINSNGCTHSVTKPVTILPQPVAAFSYALNSPGFLVNFTDFSYIPAGFSSYILKWEWADKMLSRHTIDHDRRKRDIFLCSAWRQRHLHLRAENNHAAGYGSSDRRLYARLYCSRRSLLCQSFHGYHDIR